MIATSLAISSCSRVSEKLEPQMSYQAQAGYIKSLPSPFTPLNPLEKMEEWGKEYTIGLAFAEKLDLYRAITAFKRAEILIPPERRERQKEIEYNTMLSYYLGKRYEETLDIFTHSRLIRTGSEFPAHHDLLVILYESYLETDDERAAQMVLAALKNHYPETAQRLELGTAIQEGEIDKAEELDPSLSALRECYDRKKKSISKAELLNGILPGTGYYYVGQKQTAATSFLLNGLFIAGAVYFYLDGNLPMGLILTSFEAGWYFGGIYGAGEAAKEYNERVYEQCAYPIMKQKRLFPILSLNYAF